MFRLPRLWPLDTISRIALGSASLVILTLMVIDVVTGLVPSPVAQEIARRRAVSQMLGEQVTLTATRLGAREVHELLYAVRRREPLLLGAALRSAQGEMVSSSGSPPPAVRGAFHDTSTHIRVPVLVQGQPWGALELQWAVIPQEGLPAMLLTPQSLWPLAAFLLSMTVLRLYLGKVLNQLDPSAAVPERVRNAYNTLSEAVVMLDAEGRLILINDAFRELVGQRAIQVGRRLDDHPWFREGADWGGFPVPWKIALKSSTASERVKLRLRLGEEVRTALVSCTPIVEGRRKPPRGCLVSFTDQTSIERANEHLRVTLGELKVANEEIQVKNRELTRLATRDPMTNCLNRRAFFETAGAEKDRRNLDGQPVAVVMCDIDHFKSFNDKYGHAIGDEVIKAVSGIYNRSAREHDLVCRYGGEEFCIMLPGTDEVQALQIADTLRRLVQDTAGDGIDYEPRLRITSSFGVAVTRSTRIGLEQLIDQADQALYHAKRNGRNRCTVYEEAAQAAASAPVAESVPA
ncbi:MAG: hypothetical protein RL456_3393 [Pseudomonadota bacterium]|jgi:diguanylate cyclase (GGDEF)-like protein